jgi:iron complex outermembrane receptor protein
VALGAGIRWAWQDQSATAQPGTDTSAWSGFARAAWAPDERWLLSLELATGTRFAGLSERYFTGTTGRGQVIGNPGLDPEDTLGADLGLRWQGSRSGLEIHLFRLRIDDYIERVDIDDERRSFRNLTEGDIHGIEAAAAVDWGQSWQLELGGHYIEAEDDDGVTLADSSAPRAYLGLRGEHGRWQSRLRFEYRFSENDVAPGEERLDSAKMVQASMIRNWENGLQLQLWGRNLLDERWRLSSDSLATDSSERSLGVTLSWRGPLG